MPLKHSYRLSINDIKSLQKYFEDKAKNYETLGSRIAQRIIDEIQVDGSLWYGSNTYTIDSTDTGAVLTIQNEDPNVRFTEFGTGIRGEASNVPEDQLSDIPWVYQPSYGIALTIYQSSGGIGWKYDVNEKGYIGQPAAMKFYKIIEYVQANFERIAKEELKKRRIE